MRLYIVIHTWETLKTKANRRIEGGLRIDDVLLHNLKSIKDTFLLSKQKWVIDTLHCFFFMYSHIEELENQHYKHELLIRDGIQSICVRCKYALYVAWETEPKSQRRWTKAFAIYLISCQILCLNICVVKFMKETICIYLCACRKIQPSYKHVPPHVFVLSMHVATRLPDMVVMVSGGLI